MDYTVEKSVTMKSESNSYGSFLFLCPPFLSFFFSSFPFLFRPLCLFLCLSISLHLSHFIVAFSYFSLQFQFFFPQISKVGEFSLSFKTCPLLSTTLFIIYFEISFMVDSDSNLYFFQELSIQNIKFRNKVHIFMIYYYSC